MISPVADICRCSLWPRLSAEDAEARNCPAITIGPIASSQNNELLSDYFACPCFKVHGVLSDGSAPRLLVSSGVAASGGEVV